MVLAKLLFLGLALVCAACLVLTIIAKSAGTGLGMLIFIGFFVVLAKLNKP